ncbi:sulfite exporter TauE/SafE family protein [Vogesella sp. DC21W]|uniref:Probable membrane transporter protein n=1 Tax=Vogesella aquatica TaxID=2984206 RepID=A0ABT5J0G7_9NEIS|nr:sulfite exporter TauE/SafE family protein [Vogesella aquatica]MDC7717888.1 sulfite exporter TauE/SafE family protein [Vogesella aquatica]
MLHRLRRHWTTYSLLAVLASAGLLHLAGTLHLGDTARQALLAASGWTDDPLFWTFIAIGFMAQIIDGALGMAYGVTANTALMSAGLPPAAASAGIHLAEIFTTGASGLAHLKFGNIDRQLFKRLVIPGVAGGVAGAAVLAFVDVSIIKPVVSAYLLLMGIYILLKARQQLAARGQPKRIAPLAFLGGALDSIGGGGWGPVVTTSLIGRGGAPRTVIGSVNAAEFFLSVAGAASFAVFIGVFGQLELIAGLVIGGMVAAPLAAWTTRYLPARALMTVVGLLISGLSIWNLYKALA